MRWRGLKIRVIAGRLAVAMLIAGIPLSARAQSTPQTRPDTPAPGSQSVAVDESVPSPAPAAAAASAPAKETEAGNASTPQTDAAPAAPEAAEPAAPASEDDEEGINLLSAMSSAAWEALELEKRKITTDINRKAGTPEELEGGTLVEFNRSADRLHRGFVNLARRHPDKVKVHSEDPSAVHVTIQSGNLGEDMKLVGETLRTAFPVSDAQLIDIGFAVLKQHSIEVDDRTLERIAVPAGAAVLAHQLSSNRLRLRKSGQVLRPENGRGMQLGWNAQVGRIGFGFDPEASAGLDVGYSFDAEHSVGFRARAARFTQAWAPRIDAGARLQAGSVVLDADVFHDAQSISAPNAFDGGQPPGSVYNRGGSLTLQIRDLALIASLAGSGTANSDDWAGEFGIRDVWNIGRTRIDASASTRKVLAPGRPEEAISANAAFNVRTPVGRDHDLAMGAHATIDLTCEPSGTVFASVQDLKRDLQWLFDASYNPNTDVASARVTFVMNLESRETTLLTRLSHASGRLREGIEYAERLEREFSARISGSEQAALEELTLRPLVLDLGRARVYLRNQLAEIDRTRRSLATLGVSEKRFRAYVDSDLENRARFLAKRDTFGTEQIPFGALNVTPNDVMDAVRRGQARSERDPASGGSR